MRGAVMAAYGAAGLMLASADTARASGFQLKEQSTSKLGNAFAGAGSSGDDASIMFYNPAGIALFDTPQAQADVSLINPNAYLDIASATDGTGGAISGGDGGNAASPAVVPSAYLVAPVNDHVNVGLAINVPFIKLSAAKQWGPFTKWDWSKTFPTKCVNIGYDCTIASDWS